MDISLIAHTTELTIEIIILAIGLLFILGYVSLKLYSAISMIFWGLAFITFIFHFLFEIGFRFFWLALIFVIISQMVSFTLYTVYGVKDNAI